MPDGIKLLILVLAEHKRTLSSIAVRLGSIAYAMRHEEVKRQLRERGIRFKEVEMHPADVDHQYAAWSSYLPR